MKRKDFLRNALMAMAITLVPKILLPSTGQLEEEMEEITCYNIVLGKHSKVEDHGSHMTYTIEINLEETKKIVKKSDVESEQKKQELFKEAFESYVPSSSNNQKQFYYDK